ncbi:hypothetical protein ZIOFF_073097 [Zingiber officinale]|uniref:Eukaryotic translation initiation factor 3 subunit G N-terminal domain-containing protein n=1 Tax=Zingiber officinale TaxID=94328 RepID=A0A8J5C3V1_ZINOF|nr:hypothetical protein ZIOFF_073097 [Zingiber officinale]
MDLVGTLLIHVVLVEVHQGSALPLQKSGRHKGQGRRAEDGGEHGETSLGELEQDVEDLDFLLPPRVVIGPDENGVKKVIEYWFNDAGNKVRMTTMTRGRLSKRALERRSWPKFGDVAHKDVGARLTMVSTEERLLERPRAPGDPYSPHDDKESLLCAISGTYSYYLFKRYG